jgi:hypothetical protein
VRGLIIGEAQQRQIAALRAFAAENPMDAAKLPLYVKGKDATEIRDWMKQFSIELPVGFVVTYSHEIQPYAPPPGLCHHLSVTVAVRDKMPNPIHVQAILQLFGMAALENADALWIEEVDPHTKAVNVLQLMDATENA